MNIKTLLAVICILLAYPGGLTAISMPQYAGDKKIVIVKKEQNGEEIRVRPGDMIQVELLALGSAGYAWYTDNVNSEYIEVISEETEKVSEEGKIGGPVVDIWRFRAKKEGHTEIKLDYYRKWEGKEKSADHFFIRLRITNE
jgi:predicted secreted protein